MDFSDILVGSNVLRIYHKVELTRTGLTSALFSSHFRRGCETKRTSGSQPEMHIKPITTVSLQWTNKIYHRTSYNLYSCSFMHTILRETYLGNRAPIISYTTLWLTCTERNYIARSQLDVSFLPDKCSDGTCSFSTHATAGYLVPPRTLNDVCTHHMRFSNKDKRNLCKYRVSLID